MSHRLAHFACALGSALAIVLYTGASVNAQLVATPPADEETWTALTAWGDPDLQGTWAHDSATPFERPDILADRDSLTDEEVAAMEQRAARVFDAGADAVAGDRIFLEVLSGSTERFSTGTDTAGTYNQFWLTDRWFENRTSLLIDPPDGKIPPLTPEGEARRDALRASLVAELETPPAGPEDFDDGLRCFGARIPMSLRGYNANYHIVQSPDTVALHMEMMHDTRIIPLDGRPLPAAGLPQYLGDSRGRWEGDTLVVETTNLAVPDRNTGPTPEPLLMLRDGVLVTERFTRVDEGTLRYEFTIDDPQTWTKPWTAALIMKPTPGTGRMYEYACHEGNYAVGSALRGARTQEAEAAAENGHSP